MAQEAAGSRAQARRRGSRSCWGLVRPFTRTLMQTCEPTKCKRRAWRPALARARQRSIAAIACISK
eukprot:3221357-Lingulodinium_polyedra.AAC.1